MSRSTTRLGTHPARGLDAGEDVGRGAARAASHTVGPSSANRVALGGSNALVCGRGFCPRGAMAVCGGAGGGVGEAFGACAAEPREPTGRLGSSRWRSCRRTSSSDGSWLLLAACRTNGWLKRVPEKGRAGGSGDGAPVLSQRRAARACAWRCAVCRAHARPGPRARVSERAHGRSNVGNLPTKHVELAGRGRAKGDGRALRAFVPVHAQGRAQPRRAWRPAATEHEGEGLTSEKLRR